ncbi:LAMI_0B02564g1_1 [Lachancea mirantina]|uniref:LAMI_0B02564g1_1 n=1 Tax=Lachancea mirantina TaxID=1230905 RepID=A0A1G4IU77_9SACH|nr:LAMI_0B02564g1_1 [Lachancea mirantina]
MLQTSGTLLKKLTHQISPYTSHGGAPSGAPRSLFQKRDRGRDRERDVTRPRTGVAAGADAGNYLERISTRLADELKWEAEHVERVQNDNEDDVAGGDDDDDASLLRRRRGSRGAGAGAGAGAAAAGNNGAAVQSDTRKKRKSKARLTKQRIEQLVQESRAGTNGMYQVSGGWMGARVHGSFSTVHGATLRDAAAAGFAPEAGSGARQGKAPRGGKKSWRAACAGYGLRTSGVWRRWWCVRVCV